MKLICARDTIDILLRGWTAHQWQNENNDLQEEMIYDENLMK